MIPGNPFCVRQGLYGGADFGQGFGVAHDLGNVPQIFGEGETGYSGVFS